MLSSITAGILKITGAAGIIGGFEKVDCLLALGWDSLFVLVLSIELNRTRARARARTRHARFEYEHEYD